jgi:uncharacterized membrane protein YgdD (TMEM256/DUF423 family)
MNRKYLIWGAFFGITAVILGALGAHALKAELSSAQLDSFETGVRYQIYHALLLLLIGTQKQLQSKLNLYLIPLGIIFFSLSIYLLNLKELLQMPGLSALGPITPIGGLLLITAWGELLVKGFKMKSGS